jgi:hypothetical protein
VEAGETAVTSGIVTVRDPIDTGMTLHSVTKIGLGCRALQNRPLLKVTVPK